MRCLIACAFAVVCGAFPPSLAADLYWDTNGATAGTGAAPTGTWDAVTLNWTSAAAGAIPAVVWTDNEKAIFTAGTAGIDAVNPYTVSVVGTISPLGIVNNMSGALTLTGGTFNLSASGITLAAGAGDLTVASAVTINAEQTWGNNGSGALSANGAIAINNRLTLLGTGVTRLNAANSGAGGVTLSGVTVQVGNNAAFGTGLLVLSGGTLTSSAGGSGGNRTINNELLLNGTVAFGNASYNGYSLTFNGATMTVDSDPTISNSNNNGLVFATNPLTLKTGLTINAGTTPSNVTVSGGLKVDGAAGANRTLTLNNGTSQVSLSGALSGSDTGQTITLAGSGTNNIVGAISGGTNTPQLIVNSTTGGSFTFNNQNAFGGGVKTQAGRVIVAQNSGTGTGPFGTGTLTLAGGTLRADSGADRTLTNALSITGPGTTTLIESTASGRKLTFTPAAAATISGSPTLRFDGSSGTGVVFNSGQNVASDSLTVTQDNAAPVTFNGGMTLAAGASLDVNQNASGTVTIGNAWNLGGDVDVNMNGTGKVTFNLTTGLTINGNRKINVTGSSTGLLDIVGPGDFSADAAGRTLTIDTGYTPSTGVPGVNIGPLRQTANSPALEITGTGRVQFNGSGGTFAGGTTLATTGTVVIANSTTGGPPPTQGPFGVGPITVTSGTLQADENGTGDRTIGNVLNLNGPVAFAASGTSQKRRLIFSGATNINTPTITCNDNQNASGTTFSGTTTLSTSITFDGAGAVTLSGAIIESTAGKSLSTAATFTGTVNLNAANNVTGGFSGGVAVNGGTIKLGNANGLGANGVAIAAGGTLDLNGQSISSSISAIQGAGVGSGGALINSNTTTTGTFAGNVLLAGNTSVGGAGTLVVDGVISAGGNTYALTKVGSGKTVLSGSSANTYTGVTTVSAGTLSLNKSDSVNAVGGNIIVNSGATLQSGDGNLLGHEQIPDTANVAINGTGAWSNKAKGNAVETINNLTVTGNGSAVNVNCYGGGGNIYLKINGATSLTDAVFQAQTAGSNGYLYFGGDITVTNTGTAYTRFTDGATGVADWNFDFQNGIRTINVMTNTSATGIDLDIRQKGSVNWKNGGFIKTGPGTLRLDEIQNFNTTNNLSQVQLEQGKLILGGQNLLTGSLVLNGGTLATTATGITLGSSTSANTVGAGFNTDGVYNFDVSAGSLTIQGTTAFNDATAANRTFYVPANMLTFNTVSTPNGAVNFTKTGLGVLRLTAAANADVTGQWNINAGTLSQGNAGAPGSGVVTFASGTTFDIQAAVTCNTSKTVFPSAGAMFFTSNNNALSMTGAYPSLTGPMILTGANVNNVTFSTATTLSSTNGAARTLVFSVSAGYVKLGGLILNADLTLGGGGNPLVGTAGGAAGDLGTVITAGSDAYTITKLGPNAVAIATGSTFTGAVAIKQGAIQINNTNSTTAIFPNASITLDGGALRFVDGTSNSTTLTSNIATTAAGGAIEALSSGNAGSVTFSGTIGGPGNVTLRYGGIGTNGLSTSTGFVLGGDNSGFSGGFTVTTNNARGSGVIFNAPNATGSADNSITVKKGAMVGFNYNPLASTDLDKFSFEEGGLLALNSIGAGTLNVPAGAYLTGRNNATYNTAGLVINAAGDTYKLSPGNGISMAVANVFTGEKKLLVAAQLPDTLTPNLFQLHNTNSFVFTQPQDYSGATTVRGVYLPQTKTYLNAQLQIDGSSNLPNSPSVTVEDGGTFAVNTAAASSTYAALTTVTADSSGTVILSGTTPAGTQLSAVTTMTAKGGGVLRVGSLTAANNNNVTDRFKNTAAVALGGATGGGTLTLAFPATGTHYQTIGSLSVGKGASTLNNANTPVVSATPTATLTITNPAIANNGGLLNIALFSMAAPSNSATTTNGATNVYFPSGVPANLMVGQVISGNNIQGGGNQATIVTALVDANNITISQNATGTGNTTLTYTTTNGAVVLGSTPALNSGNTFGGWLTINLANISPNPGDFATVNASNQIVPVGSAGAVGAYTTMDNASFNDTSFTNATNLNLQTNAATFNKTLSASKTINSLRTYAYSGFRSFTLGIPADATLTVASGGILAGAYTGSNGGQGAITINGPGTLSSGTADMYLFAPTANGNNPLLIAAPLSVNAGAGTLHIGATGSGAVKLTSASNNFAAVNVMGTLEVAAIGAMPAAAPVNLFGGTLNITHGTSSYSGNVYVGPQSGTLTYTSNNNTLTLSGTLTLDGSLGVHGSNGPGQGTVLMTNTVTGRGTIGFGHGGNTGGKYLLVLSGNNAAWTGGVRIDNSTTTGFGNGGSGTRHIRFAGANSSGTGPIITATGSFSSIAFDPGTATVTYANPFVFQNSVSPIAFWGVGPGLAAAGGTGVVRLSGNFDGTSQSLVLQGYATADDQVGEVVLTGQNNLSGMPTGYPAVSSFGTTAAPQNFVNGVNGITLGVTGTSGTTNIATSNNGNGMVDLPSGQATQGALGFVRFSSQQSLGFASAAYFSAVRQAGAGQDGRFGYLLTGTAAGATYQAPAGKSFVIGSLGTGAQVAGTLGAASDTTAAESAILVGTTVNVHANAASDAQTLKLFARAADDTLVLGAAGKPVTFTPTTGDSGTTSTMTPLVARTGTTTIEKVGAGIVSIVNADYRTVGGGDAAVGFNWVVTAGTLLANNTSGSATGGGAVTVAAGATLGGSGSLAGVVTLNGALAPSSAGMTVGGLNLTNNSQLTLQQGLSGGVGLINVTGVLNLAGTGETTLVNVSALSGLTAGLPYHFLQYGGTAYTDIIGKFKLTGSLPSGFTNVTFTPSTGNYIDLTFVGAGIGVGSGTWTGATSNVWSTTVTGNWSIGVPSAAGHVATFPTGPTNTSIVWPETKTVGKVEFAGNSYTLGTSTGPALILDQGTVAGVAQISATAGSHAIAAEVKTAASGSGTNLDVTTSGDGRLALTNVLSIAADKTVNLVQSNTTATEPVLVISSVSNAGSLVVQQSGMTENNLAIKVSDGIDGLGNTTVGTTGTGATTATLITEHIRQNTLTINAGSRVTIQTATGSSGTSVVNFLNIWNPNEGSSGGFNWSTGTGGFTAANLPAGGAVTAVPEPATWMLLVLAALAGLLVRRKPR